MANWMIPSIVTVIGAAAIGVTIFLTTKRKTNPSPKDKNSDMVNSKVDTQEDNASNADGQNSTSQGNIVKTEIKESSDCSQTEFADITVDTKSWTLAGDSTSGNGSLEDNSAISLMDSNSVGILKRDNKNSRPPEGALSSDNTSGGYEESTLLPTKNNRNKFTATAAAIFSANGAPSFCIHAEKSHNIPVVVLGQDRDDSDNREPIDTINCIEAFHLFTAKKLKTQISVQDRVANVPMMYPMIDSNWDTLCGYARYAKQNKKVECARYTGLSQWSKELYEDLNDILSCLSLNDSFPDIKEAYPDMETRKPEHSMFIFFYDTSTNEQIDIADALAMDTTNGSELKSLDNLGILFKICDSKTLGRTIVKVPFKNSLQKKVVIRYLQLKLILDTLKI